jgi:hypothetical protein
MDSPGHGQIKLRYKNILNPPLGDQTYLYYYHSDIDAKFGESRSKREEHCCNSYQIKSLHLNQNEQMIIIVALIGQDQHLPPWPAYAAM